MDKFDPANLLKDWTWKGRPLTAEEITKLKEQAAMFKKAFIWEVLKSEMEWFAIKTLLERGVDGEDIRIARIFGNFVQGVDRKLVELSK